MTEKLIDIITPTGRILVKEIEIENKTAGGIILTEKASDPDNTCKLGEIIYNGIRVDNHEDESYQEGNKVYFGKYAGATINHNGEKYISLTENEISAITI